jgi:hemoglobin-like flavoprotein
MNKVDITEIFTDSYVKCTSNPKFLDTFYELFISSSDEIKEKFKNTDMDDQKLALQASLSYIILASRDSEACRYLDKIAETHSSRDYNIKPHLYDIWLECMIQTVKIYDAEFNSKVEEAWIKTMKVGIDYLKSKYE